MLRKSTIFEASTRLRLFAFDSAFPRMTRSDTSNIFIAFPKPLISNPPSWVVVSDSDDSLSEESLGGGGI